MTQISLEKIRFDYFLNILTVLEIDKMFNSLNFLCGMDEFGEPEQCKCSFYSILYKYEY